MPTYFRTLLAAFVLLLALPVSAQLGDVATTGGTTVERQRANTNKPADRNTRVRTRANTNQPADRNTRNRPTQTRPSNRNTDPNYCPPPSRRNNDRPATYGQTRRDNNNGAARGNNRARANDQTRWYPTPGSSRNRSATTTHTTTQQRPASGVSTSILFGKKGQDVGRAKKEKPGTSYVPRQ